MIMWFLYWNLFLFCCIGIIIFVAEMKLFARPDINNINLEEALKELNKKNKWR